MPPVVQISPALDKEFRNFTESLNKDEAAIILADLKERHHDPNSLKEVDLLGTFQELFRSGKITENDLDILRITAKKSQNKNKIISSLDNFQRSLPSRNDALVARSNDKQELLKLLSDQNIHGINLHGISGVGKTTIAKEIAKEFANNSWEELTFDLREVKDIDTAYLYILYQLGMTGNNRNEVNEMEDETCLRKVERNQILDCLRKRCTKSKIFLVFDNVEAEIIEDHKDEFNRFLNDITKSEACKNGMLKIILTSLSEIPVSSIRNHCVKPLPIPASKEFICRKSKSDFYGEDFTEVNEDAALSRIAEYCQNIPFFLEGAEQMLRNGFLTPVQLLQQIDTQIEMGVPDKYLISGAIFQSIPTDNLKKLAVKVCVFPKYFSASETKKIAELKSDYDGELDLEYLTNHRVITKVVTDEGKTEYDVHSLFKEFAASYLKVKFTEYQEAYSRAELMFGHHFVEKLLSLADKLDKDFAGISQEIQEEKFNFEVALQLTLRKEELLVRLIQSHERIPRVTILLEYLKSIKERKALFKTWADALEQKGDLRTSAYIRCWEYIQVAEIEGTVPSDILHRAEVCFQDYRTVVYIGRPCYRLAVVKGLLHYCKGKLNYMQSVYLNRGQDVNFQLLKKALQNYKDALEIHQNNYGNHIMTAKTLNGIGNCYMELGHSEKAKGYYIKALQMKLTLNYGIEKHIELPTCYNQLSQAYQKLGDKEKGKQNDYYYHYEKAVLCLKEAIRLNEDLGLVDTLSTSTFNRNLSNSLIVLERYDEALVCAEKCYELRNKLLGDHPETVRILYLMGVINECRKYYPAALLSYEASFKMEELLPIGNHSAMLVGICDRLENMCKTCNDNKKLQEYRPRIKQLKEQQHVQQQDEHQQEQEQQEQELLEQHQQQAQQDDLEEEHYQPQQQQEQTFSLDENGGSYDFSSAGLHLQVTPDAVNEKTNLTVKQLSKDTLPSPARELDGVVSSIIQFEPANVVFKKPVVATLLHYGPTRTAHYETVAMVFNESTNTWEKVEDIKESSASTKSRSSFMQVQMTKLTALTVVTRLITDTFEVPVSGCVVRSSVCHDVTLRFPAGTVDKSTKGSLRVLPMPDVIPDVIPMDLPNVHVSPIVVVDGFEQTAFTEDVLLTLPNPAICPAGHKRVAGQVHVLRHEGIEWKEITETVEYVEKKSTIELRVRHFSKLWLICSGTDVHLGHHLEQSIKPAIGPAIESLIKLNKAESFSLMLYASDMYNRLKAGPKQVIVLAYIFKGLAPRKDCSTILLVMANDVRHVLVPTNYEELARITVDMYPNATVLTMVQGGFEIHGKSVKLTLNGDKPCYEELKCKKKKIYQGASEDKLIIAFYYDTEEKTKNVIGELTVDAIHLGIPPKRYQRHHRQQLERKLHEQHQLQKQKEHDGKNDDEEQQFLEQQLPQKKQHQQEQTLPLNEIVQLGLPSRRYQRHHRQQLERKLHEQHQLQKQKEQDDKNDDEEQQFLEQQLPQKKQHQQEQTLPLDENGGSYDFSSAGLHLQVPPDAVNEKTNLTVKQLSKDTLPSPARELDGVVSSIIQFEPANLVFEKPVVATLLHYGSTRTAHYATVAMVFNDGTNTWEKVEDIKESSTNSRSSFIQVQLTKLTALTVVTRLTTDTFEVPVSGCVVTSSVCHDVTLRFPAGAVDKSTKGSLRVLPMSDVMQMDRSDIQFSPIVVVDGFEQTAFTEDVLLTLPNPAISPAGHERVAGQVRVLSQEGLEWKDITETVEYVEGTSTIELRVRHFFKLWLICTDVLLEYHVEQSIEQSCKEIIKWGRAKLLAPLMPYQFAIYNMFKAGPKQVIFLAFKFKDLTPRKDRFKILLCMANDVRHVLETFPSEASPFEEVARITGDVDMYPNATVLTMVQGGFEIDGKSVKLTLKENRPCYKWLKLIKKKKCHGGNEDKLTIALYYDTKIKAENVIGELTVDAIHLGIPPKQDEQEQELLEQHKQQRQQQPVEKNWSLVSQREQQPVEPQDEHEQQQELLEQHEQEEQQQEQQHVEQQDEHQQQQELLEQHEQQGQQQEQQQHVEQQDEHQQQQELIEQHQQQGQQQEQQHVEQQDEHQQQQELIEQHQQQGQQQEQQHVEQQDEHQQQQELIEQHQQQGQQQEQQHVEQQDEHQQQQELIEQHEQEEQKQEQQHVEQQDEHQQQQELLEQHQQQGQEQEQQHVEQQDEHQQQQELLEQHEQQGQQQEPQHVEQQDEHKQQQELQQQQQAQQEELEEEQYQPQQQQELTFSLDENGGSYDFSSAGLYLQFPPDAVNEKTNFTFKQLSKDTLPSPARELDGVVSSIIQFEPTNLVFEKPVVATLWHNGPTRTAHYVNVAMAFNESTNTWERIRMQESSSSKNSTSISIQVQLTKLTALTVVARLITDTFEVLVSGCEVRSSVCHDVTLRFPAGAVDKSTNGSLRVLPMPDVIPMDIPNVQFSPIVVVDGLEQTAFTKDVLLTLPNPAISPVGHERVEGKIHVLRHEGIEWKDITETVEYVEKTSTIELRVKHFSIFWAYVANVAKATMAPFRYLYNLLKAGPKQVICLAYKFKDLIPREEFIKILLVMANDVRQIIDNCLPTTYEELSRNTGDVDMYPNATVLTLVQGGFEIDGKSIKLRLKEDQPCYKELILKKKSSCHGDSEDKLIIAFYYETKEQTSNNLISQLTIDAMHLGFPPQRKEIPGPNREGAFLVKKGILVIIEITKLKSLNDIDATEREGSEKDVQALENTFRNVFHFRVEYIRNKTKKDILDELERIVGEATEYDCCAVCVLSHGESGGFFDINWEKIKESEITNILKDNLLGKPKLLFFQACRTHPQNKTENKEVNNEVATSEKALSDPDTNILRDSDLLIAYPCADGQTACRDPSFGSPFIVLLCEVFGDKYTTMDILSMLTVVNIELKKHKQQICGATTYLSKHYYFTS